MWWAVLKQAVVVGRGSLAPASLGVVAGLVGQHRSLFGLEIDLALGVAVPLRVIQDVHDYEGKPTAAQPSSPFGCTVNEREFPHQRSG